VRSFLHVTLPLSAPGMLAAAVITALPMFGDFYTTDLLSGSPRTTMIGNQIRFYLLDSSEKNVGASLVVVLSVLLMVLMAYYLVTTDRATRAAMR
jgi:spermidine/putrescine transport system permease protein